MAIESNGGYHGEDPYDMPLPSGESLAVPGESGINALRNLSGQTGGDIFVQKEPSGRISHFPINVETAEHAVATEAELLRSEGDEKYLATTERGIAHENPTLVKTIKAESGDIEEKFGVDVGKSYVIGAFVGYKAVDAQSDGTLPQVTPDTVDMARKDREQEALLASFAWGKYTSRPEQDANYLVSVAQGAPPSNEGTFDMAAFMKGATDTYHLLRGADQVRKLEALYRMRYMP